MDTKANFERDPSIEMPGGIVMKKDPSIKMPGEYHLASPRRGFGLTTPMKQQ